MEREQIFVTPAPGMKVRHPDTKKYIKEAGEHVDRSSYWTRRQIAGEVTISSPKKTPAKKKKGDE